MWLRWGSLGALCVRTYPPKAPSRGKHSFVWMREPKLKCYCKDSCFSRAAELGSLLWSQLTKVDVYSKGFALWPELATQTWEYHFELLEEMWKMQDRSSHRGLHRESRELVNPGSVAIWLLAKWSWEATSWSPEGKVYVSVEPSGGQKWLNRGTPAKQGLWRREARTATGSVGRAGLLKLPRLHLKSQVADVELQDLLSALVCFRLGVPDQSLLSLHSPFCNMTTSLCQFALKIGTSIFYGSSQFCVALGLQWRLDLVILNSVSTV